MDSLVKICILLFVALISALVLYIAFGIKKRVNTALLLKNQPRSEKLVYRILEANFGRKNLLRNPVFAANLSPNARLFRLNAVLVTRSCVLLVIVRNFVGNVENPFQGDWRQFSNNAVKQFDNPLELSAGYTNSVRLLMKEMKVSNVPLKSVVVYLDRGCKFKNKIHQIVLVDRLIPYIRDLNRDRAMKWYEIKKATNALKTMARTPQASKQPAQYRSNYQQNQ